MTRGKKLLYNSLASILSEGVSLICGFILPRLILGGFGSSYNGLTQSVSQFLSVVALMRAGVGGATRAVLYRALAANDKQQINAIIRATELFMRKVALIFAGFVLVFSCVYPLIISTEFEWLFSASLVLIIAASTFVQYFFGITYQMLLQADQRQFVHTLLHVATVVLNTIVSVILIRMGFGIHAVKLGSSLVFCISPIFLYVYAHRHYQLDHHVKPDYSSINQRWDAMFHQLAGFIHGNTDIMLLTLFTNLREVSVYSTYCLVSNGLKQLMNTVTSGVEAAFGDMIARGDRKVLVRNVRLYETLLHGVVIVIYGAALVLITPFISVYTHGINDVNYIRFAFGYILICVDVTHLLRQPYHSLVEAAGHFKQTKYIPLIQAIGNIVISLLLVYKLGLVGVLLGTLVSDAWQALAYRVYVKRHLIPEMTVRGYVKRLVTTGLTILLIFLVGQVIPFIGEIGYGPWIVYAIYVVLVSGACAVASTFVCYRQDGIAVFKKILVMLKRRNGQKH